MSLNILALHVAKHIILVYQAQTISKHTNKWILRGWTEATERENFARDGEREEITRRKLQFKKKIVPGHLRLVYSEGRDCFKRPVCWVTKLPSVQTKEHPSRLPWAGLALPDWCNLPPIIQCSPTARCWAPGCLGERPAGSTTLGLQSAMPTKFLCE